MSRLEEGDKVIKFTHKCPYVKRNGRTLLTRIPKEGFQISDDEFNRNLVLKFPHIIFTEDALKQIPAIVGEKDLEEPIESKAPKADTKKKKKKKKKKGKKKMFCVDYSFDDEDTKILSSKDKRKAKSYVKKLDYDDKEYLNSNILAGILKYKNNLIVCNNTLWIYDKNKGAFSPKDQKEAETSLRSLLDEDQRLKTKNNELTDAYKNLLIQEELQREVTFNCNQPLVNCKNGVLDLESMKLLPHSYTYGFKYCIDAEYDPDAEGENFKSFIDSIVEDDKELKKLLQEVTGYALSMYNNAKKAFILYGPPQTGKSVYLNLLSEIVGRQNISNVNIQQLNRQEYVAQLANSLLNISPDLPSEPLKDIGMFKSLVSNNDTIMARMLYANAQAITGGTKMLFASNHLLELAITDTNDIGAFFERIIYLPFKHAVKPGNEDKNLFEKLKKERNFIFTWAMKGLQRYIKNGEQFSECESSSEIHNKHRSKFCPAAYFAEKYLSFKDKTAHTLTEDVNNLYLEYCLDYIGKKGKKDDIRKYLKEVKKIDKTRDRINGHKYARACYIGVKIKNSVSVCQHFAENSEI